MVERITIWINERANDWLIKERSDHYIGTQMNNWLAGRMKETFIYYINNLQDPHTYPVKRNANLIWQHEKCFLLLLLLLFCFLA